MNGIINAAKPNAGAPMSSPVLQAAEDKIEAGLAPDNVQNYQKIVVAGMAAALERGPNSLLASLRKSPDPVEGAAKGAVALVLILRRHAHGVMPLKAMVPAAMTLMLRGLDFVARTGVAKVGTPELVRATHVFVNTMFGAFHITVPMLHKTAAQVHAITQDPQKMEMIHRKIGSVVAPGASQATSMPAS
jgi:hypothetical protein